MNFQSPQPPTTTANHSFRASDEIFWSAKITSLVKLTYPEARSFFDQK